MQDIQWVGIDPNEGAFFHVCTKNRTYHFLGASHSDSRCCAAPAASTIVDATQSLTAFPRRSCRLVTHSLFGQRLGQCTD